ncbi:MAG: hypothetical protein HY062_16615 [Bacteroidetes bacterium]|nr:hypothetical protein [Bacteroidota bacterium]
MKKSIPSIKILFTICFIVFGHILISQEEKLKSNNGNSKASAKQNTASTNDDALRSKVSKNMSNNAAVQKQVDTQGQSFQLDENDMYQGRKEEFLSQITLKELPVDFPKYEKWMGVRHYNEAIDDYYRKHLDIVIPIVKQKLTQAH